MNKIKFFIRNVMYKIHLFFHPIDTDKMYRDQAATSTRIADRYISCYYLPFGIKILDSEYSQRIMNIDKSKENPKKLMKEIKSNPHLHKEIKKNLLFNLKTYTSKNV